MSNYAERIAKGSLWVFVITMITAALGYILRIYLARSLSVEEFGIFFAVLSVVGFLLTFKDIGFGSAVSRFIPEFLVKKKHSEIKSTLIFIVTVQLLIALIIFIPLFFFSDKIAIVFFHNAEASILLKIFAIEFLVSFTIIRSMFAGLQKMSIFAVIEMVRVCIILFLVLSFPLLSTYSVAYFYLFASVAVQAGSILYLLKKYPRFIKIKSVRQKEIYSNIMRYSVVVFAGAIAWNFIAYIDTFMLTYFRSASEVALYQVASSTSQLLWIFAASFEITLLPLFSEIWAKNQKDLLSKGLSSIIKLMFVFIIPLAFLMLAFPEIILNTIFKGEYIASAMPLQILSMAAIFYTLMIVLITTTKSINKPSIATKTILKIAILHFILDLILVPAFGINGAAISTFIVFLTGFLIVTYRLKNYLKLTVDIKAILKAFFVGIIMLAIITVTKALLVMDPIPEAVIVIAIAFVFYIIAISKFKVINSSDLLFLRRTNLPIPKKIKNLIEKILVI